MKNTKSAFEILIASIVLATILYFANTANAMDTTELHTVRQRIKYATEVPVIQVPEYSEPLNTGNGYAIGAYYSDKNRIVIKNNINAFDGYNLLAHEVSHYVWYRKTTKNQQRWFCRNTKNTKNATWYILATSKQDNACAERFAEMRMLRLYGNWSFLPETPVFNFLKQL